jgi:hypothetical protein
MMKLETQSTRRPPQPQDNLRDFGTRSRFQGYGEEMLEKTVRRSGNSGRVYLPQEWVGKTVKIIRLD